MKHKVYFLCWSTSKCIKQISNKGFAKTTLLEVVVQAKSATYRQVADFYRKNQRSLLSKKSLLSTRKWWIQDQGNLPNHENWIQVPNRWTILLLENGKPTLSIVEMKAMVRHIRMQMWSNNWFCFIKKAPKGNPFMRSKYLFVLGALNSLVAWAVALACHVLGLEFPRFLS